MEFAKLAKEVDVLKPFGHTDTLLYYAIVASKLQNFLRDKEIATKIWLPHGSIPFFLKRGSKSKPFYISDFSCVDEDILKLRSESDLKSARNRINGKQALVWDYFVPRKLIDFFYATNNEGVGKPIERIFIDVDRGQGITAEQVQEVTRLLVQEINNDKQLAKLFKFKIFIMWTGSSFHVYLLLRKKMGNSDYEKYFAYKKDLPLQSFIGRWADSIQKKTKIKVQGGHEKLAGGVNFDPSQTPSGKLARAPFSLHLKSATEIDGVALPVAKEQLQDKLLVKKLKSYTPKKVIEELDKLAKLLP
jgi:DNA primase